MFLSVEMTSKSTFFPFTLGLDEAPPTSSVHKWIDSFHFHLLFPAARALPPLSGDSFILKGFFCGQKREVLRNRKR